MSQHNPANNSSQHSTYHTSQQTHVSHELDVGSDNGPHPADSRADAIAILAIITIAVCGVLFFISQQ